MKPPGPKSRVQNRNRYDRKRGNAARRSAGRPGPQHADSTLHFGSADARIKSRLQGAEKASSPTNIRPGLSRSKRFAQVGCGWLVLTLLSASALGSESLNDQALAQIRFDQRLGTQVSASLLFTDEQGQAVRFGQYFHRKPIVLVLGYYGCPMLCTLVLNGMVESAADMKWSIGRDFEVINVSIDPAETSALAARKRKTYLKRYGRTGAGDGWHFLTGSEAAIAQLAKEVGFHYAYDPPSKQYAHPSGLVVLTPEGKVSRYLFGVTFPSKDLYTALRDASDQKVGSPIQQLILLCFHYNPITGKYSATILGILRLLSVVTLVCILGLVIQMTRRRQPNRLENVVGANVALTSPPQGTEDEAHNASSP